MNKEQLDKILKDHKLWLESDKKEGKGAYLQGANLQGANLQRTDLREANLREAYLQGANLQGANLRGANLQEANLREANLQRTDLREAYLQGANLQEANLREAYLQGANLQEANLQRTNIITFQANRDFAFHHEGYIKIGCKGMMLDEWLDRYEEIGKEEGYTNQEITMYGHWLKGLKLFS